MKQQVRELLVTAKVAQNWAGEFNEKVEELMVLVTKIDTDKQVLGAGELLDVYHKSKQRPVKARKRRMSDQNEKPFEFLVFRN